MKTQAELATGVLRLLGIVDATASPSAVDSAYVVKTYTDTHPYWLDLGLAYWPVAEIPDAVFPMLIALTANRAQNAFGSDLAQTLEAMLAREDALLVPLRRHCSKRASGVPMRVLYY